MSVRLAAPPGSATRSVTRSVMRSVALNRHPAMCGVVRYNRSVGVSAASFLPSLGRLPGHTARERHTRSRGLLSRLVSFSYSIPFPRAR